MKPPLIGVAVALALGSACSSAWAECTCRAKGTVASQGQTACIQTPNGPRLARCDKVSNVTSWTFLDSRCPGIVQSQLREAPAGGGLSGIFR